MTEVQSQVRKSSVKWDLTGKRIGGLVVLERAPDVIRPNGKKRPIYLCMCDCGTRKLIESQTLVSGKCLSCGCKRKKNPGGFKHGMSDKPIYGSYRHMIGRCYNKKECGYDQYGGRGITVCPAWSATGGLGFREFLNDMGEPPEGYILDRIDPDGNYCPENCRWVNRSLSSYNTRKAKNNTSTRTGVYWFERVSKWVAAIHVNKKQKHLGYFLDFKSACLAREKAEMLYFGETKA